MRFPFCPHNGHNRLSCFFWLLRPFSEMFFSWKTKSTSRSSSCQNNSRGASASNEVLYGV
jgi:hypothetical protein